MLTHSLGFPRIGASRELKKAVEAYWSGSSDKEQLLATGTALRLQNWRTQHDAGLSLVPVGDFSYYDHMLDTAALLGCVPSRYDLQDNHVGLDTFFRMARGGDGVTAMEMTKWFDTNYHYIVPEFTRGQKFKPSTTKIFDEVREAEAAGFAPKPVLPGPFTLLHLGKSVEPDFDKWDLLDDCVRAYAEILRKLAPHCQWIQLDEPVLCQDLPQDVLDRFIPAYAELKRACAPAKLLLATYFGAIDDKAALLPDLPVHGLHIDLVRAPEQLESVAAALPDESYLSLGLVNGRNIWATDQRRALQLVERAKALRGSDHLMIAPSCSLLHSPVDLSGETALDPEVRSWMAFAVQKCDEVALLARAASGEDVAVELERSDAIQSSRRTSEKVVNQSVRKRLAEVTPDMSRRDKPFAQRIMVQRQCLNLPLLPTTTIGSFPQTPDIRATRRRKKSGELSQAEYVKAMQGFIDECIREQEVLDLDVLVHGEAERNDMVEYFGELLEGFCFTANGWVQSYGSRCVKPPVIFGDVTRPEAMTVDWTTYAQRQTTRPVKGMLTGPVTILCWSFVRDDQPRRETCRQIALAIRDEVADLEQAGTPIIQIDEPALREGMPLRRQDWDDYLNWAVDCFKLATCPVRDDTQIHTHMCYSEFNEIIESIAAMDADVISIEASRSKMELLEAFGQFEYPNEVGPGIWDIHSPRVPPVEEMIELLRKAEAVIPRERLWVNPDCGLKTRGWPESRDALRNLVAAAKALR
jgi:5-methyltetrahydropteroyltriglutamate--homocysteine methyltransferase